MSILNGATGTKTGTGTVNPWAAKVTVQSAAPAWWNTASVIGVAEVNVGGVFSLLVHVARSAKSGRIFATMPSTKKGDAWLPNVEIHDAQLREAVHNAAIAAVEAMQRAAPGTPAAPVASDDLPF